MIGCASKKVNQDGMTLVIADESGFSFVPNHNHTWAPIGETPLLQETPGQHNHTTYFEINGILGGNRQFPLGLWNRSIIDLFYVRSNILSISS
jgi:hypothetical protein